MRERHPNSDCVVAPSPSPSRGRHAATSNPKPKQNRNRNMTRVKCPIAAKFTHPSPSHTSLWFVTVFFPLTHSHKHKHSTRHRHRHLGAYRRFSAPIAVSAPSNGHQHRRRITNFPPTMPSPTSSLSPPRPAPLPSSLSSSSFISRHASPPVPSSHLPLPPCPPGPSRSLSDPLMKRQWQPLVAAPLTHVDSRSSAGKLTAVGDVREELERDLSTSK